ncbi:MAG: hypothetical protein Q9182_006286 [Xanthomendoza sp. 2 TL-2023]
MHSNPHLTCYRIDKPSPGKQTQKAPMGLSPEAIAKGLSRMNFKVQLASILSDHQGSLVLFSDSPDSDSSIQLPGCEINLTTIATIRGKDLLEFLHSTRSFENKNLQGAVLGVIQALLSQKSPSNYVESVQEKSLPALEIFSAPSQNKERSLIELMERFMKADPHNLHGLETYLGALGFKSAKTKVGTLEVTRAKSKPQLGWHDQTMDHKGQPIRDADLPLVNVGTRSKPKYIPPDFCTVRVRHEQNSSVLDFGDVMQITKNVMVANAKMPQWFNSYDADGWSRHPGLKMPLADNLSTCQISVTADALLMSCRTKKAPKIKYLEGKEFAPHSGAWSLKLSRLEANRTVPARGKVAVLVIKQGRWPAEEQTTKTLQALQDRLRSFGLSLSETLSLSTVVIKDGKLE